MNMTMLFISKATICMCVSQYQHMWMLLLMSDMRSLAFVFEIEFTKSVETQRSYLITR